MKNFISFAFTISCIPGTIFSMGGPLSNVNLFQNQQLYAATWAKKIFWEAHSAFKAKIVQRSIQQIGIGVATAVGTQLIIDLVHGAKSTITRFVWGPTKVERLLEDQLETSLQQEKIKLAAMNNAFIKKTYEDYKAYMRSLIDENKNNEEKENLKKDFRDKQELLKNKYEQQLLNNPSDKLETNSPKNPMSALPKMPMHAASAGQMQQ
jgi:hypothetical protein